MRRSVVVGTVMLLLACVLVGGPSLLFSPPTNEITHDNESNPEAEIVRPTGGESGFWPYLNSQQTFDKRSPINVVVTADTEEVIPLLIESDNSSWEETDEEQEEAAPGDAINGGNDSNGNVSNEAQQSNSTRIQWKHIINGENSSNANNTNANNSNGNESDELRINSTEIHLKQTTTEENDSDAENDSTDNGSDDEIRVGSTNVQWRQTTGANRYAYVDPGDGDGKWVEETAQIHDGTYYGHRYHIRMYESPNPNESWVAMQTHSEHFDWFTLRHRVAGSQKAQTHLETDLRNLPQVDEREDVRRVYLGNGNSSDGDGWATFVDLVGVVLAGLVIGLSMPTGALRRVDERVDDHLTEADRRRINAIRERVTIRHLLLAGTIVALVVGVRIGGITLESTDRLSMHAIATVLYPFIAVGLPLGTYLIASGLDRRLDTAVVAGGSLSVAIWLDYGLLGVNSLPIDVIAQRMLVVVALGLIAGGATRNATRNSRWNDTLLVGVVLWVLMLASTLLGYV